MEAGRARLQVWSRESEELPRSGERRMSRTLQEEARGQAQLDCPLGQLYTQVLVPTAGSYQGHGPTGLSGFLPSSSLLGSGSQHQIPGALALSMA